MVGISAGVFAFLALILVMEGIAWLLNEEVFDGKTWPGFFIEAAVFLLIAALAALIAYKAVKAGSPPVPEQAIEEAKLTKETLTKVDGEMSVDPRTGRPVDRRSARPLGRADPPRHRRPAAAARAPQRRGAARQGHRSHRLAPPGRGAQRQLIIGAAAVGFLIGIKLMRGRRRRRG